MSQTKLFEDSIWIKANMNQFKIKFDNLPPSLVCFIITNMIIASEYNSPKSLNKVSIVRYMSNILSQKLLRVGKHIVKRV